MRGDFNIVFKKLWDFLPRIYSRKHIDALIAHINILSKFIDSLIHSYILLHRLSCIRESIIEYQDNEIRKKDKTIAELRKKLSLLSR